MIENFNKINTFILIAELNGFRKAAEALSVSATAVSKQIQSLEASLSEQLFIRTTRHIQLTEFGEQYYALCKNVQNDLAILEQFACSRQQEPQGRLKILVQNDSAMHLLLTKLSGFHHLYPKIQMDIEYSERRDHINTKQYDVIMSYGDTQTFEHLRVKKLLTLRHALCAAPKYIR